MKKIEILANNRLNLNPIMQNKYEFADIEADFTIRGQEDQTAVKIMTADEFCRGVDSGFVRRFLEKWQGKHGVIFAEGAWDVEFARYAAEALADVQRYGVPIVARGSRKSAWPLVERFLCDEHVPIGDVLSLERPRMSNESGVLERDWSLRGLRETLRIQILIYGDIMCAERDEKPFPEIIQDLTAKYRYYCLFYRKTGAPLDTETAYRLAHASEPCGALFMSGAAKDQLGCVEKMANLTWKQFLNDIDNQFNKNS